MFLSSSHKSSVDKGEHARLYQKTGDQAPEKTFLVYTPVFSAQETNLSFSFFVI